jgi:HPt (histidine-containing phosphotransfer) domain-containing protein
MTDRYNLSKIKAFIGDDEIVMNELIDLFLEHTPEMVLKIKDGLAKEDYDQVNFYAHKLKSSVDNFSINELIEDVRTIENNAKKRLSLENLPDLISKLDSVIKDIINEIKKDFNKK